MRQARTLGIDNSPSELSKSEREEYRRLFLKRKGSRIGRLLLQQSEKYLSMFLAGRPTAEILRYAPKRAVQASDKKAMTITTVIRVMAAPVSLISSSTVLRFV